MSVCIVCHEYVVDSRVCRSCLRRYEFQSKDLTLADLASLVMTGRKNLRRIKRCWKVK